MALRKKNGKVAGKKKTHQEQHAENAERLAPLEEKTGEVPALVAAANNGGKTGSHAGVIIVDTGALSLPKGFGGEAPESDQKRYLPNPAVMLILALFLIFIIFIAYLISKEPPRSEPAPGKAILLTQMNSIS
jgi:hypothetical protein